MENIYQKFGKRAIDIIFSFLAFIIFSPVILILIPYLLYEHGRPLFFIQERVGLNEKIFKLYKLRSMTNEIDEKGELLPDSKRITSLGKVLRSTSLDELPNLWNIFKGDMSFVGPRPLLVEYLPYYTAEELKRHSVRPGLTGWAQINGRTSVNWEERFQYDVDYVQKLSLLIDLKILFSSVYIVLKRSDIGYSDDGVLEDFDVHRQNQIMENNHIIL